MRSSTARCLKASQACNPGMNSLGSRGKSEPQQSILKPLQVSKERAQCPNKFGMDIKPTLSQTWTVNKSHGPQYAFKMSMFMCPAVHITTRSSLRSSSTPEPSDPLYSVVFQILNRC